MPSAIALVAPSLEILGGQGIQARALADAWRADGSSIIFVPINPRFPRFLQWLRGIRYLRTVFNETLYISRLRALRAADVVHVFSASYWSFMLAPVPAILAAKLLCKPVILHYHSGEAADHLAKWGWFLKPLLRLVDAIVVPSSYLQRVFALHGYIAQVIPNVIDTSSFHYRERAPLQANLLSVRNLEPHYGVDAVILGFARLKERFPEATLIVAGYGSQEQKLRRLVTRIGVSGVRFVGRVEPEALTAIYEAADIFVNASTIDNQPVSILEAFASGLPVVSTPAGDIAAMLCNGDAGLLIGPGDPSGLASAVTRLLEEPGLATRIAVRAREQLQRHQWSCIREQWSAVYAEVLTPAAARRRDRSPARTFASHV